MSSLADVLVKTPQEALLYAPMSNVGSVMYDKDAVYIDMPQIHFSGVDDVQDWGSDEEGAKAASVGFSFALFLPRPPCVCAEQCVPVTLVELVVLPGITRLVLAPSPSPAP